MPSVSPATAPPPDPRPPPGPRGTATVPVPAPPGADPCRGSRWIPVISALSPFQIPPGSSRCRSVPPSWGCCCCWGLRPWPGEASGGGVGRAPQSRSRRGRYRGACRVGGARRRGAGPRWAGRGAVQDGRGVGVPRRAAPHGRGRERGDPTAPGAAAAAPRGAHGPRQRRHRPLRPRGCLRVQVLRVPRHRVQPGGEAILHHHPGLQQRPAAVRDPQRFLLFLQHPEELPGSQHGALGVQRAHRGVLGRAVLPVLRVPVPAAEHDAGLRSHGDVPEGDPAEPQRLQGQDRAGRGLWLGHPLLLRRAGRGAQDLRRGGQHHGPARRGAGEEQQPDGADRGDPGQGGGGVAARAGGHHHLGAHGLHALQRAHAGELPARQEVPETQWEYVPHHRGRAPGALHGRAALHGAVHQGQLLVPAVLPRRRSLGAARRRRGRVLQAARGGHLRHPDPDGQIRQIHRELLGSQGGRLAQDRNPLQVPHAALGAGARPGLLVRCGLHRLHNDGVALHGAHGAPDPLVPGALPVPVAAVRQGRRHPVRDLPAGGQQETELRHQHRGPGGPDGLQILQPARPEKSLLQVHGHDPLAPPRLPLRVPVGEHVEHGQHLQHEHGHGRGWNAGGLRPEQRHRGGVQRGAQQPHPPGQHRHRQPHPLQDGLHHEHGHCARLVQRSERRRLQRPLPPEQPVHHGGPPHLHGLPHVHHHQHDALRQLKDPPQKKNKTQTEKKSRI